MLEQVPALIGEARPRTHSLTQPIHARIRQRADSATPSLASLYRTALAAVDAFEPAHLRHESIQEMSASYAKMDDVEEEKVIENEEAELPLKPRRRLPIIVVLFSVISILTIVIGLAAGLTSNRRHASGSESTSSSRHKPTSSSRATTTQNPAPTLPPGNYYPQRVASMYSMTSAAVPLHPMPTAAMTNDSAQSHIQSNWAYAGGATDYLSFVDDPFEDNGTALAVKFRRGSEGGGGPGTAGGVGAMMLKVFGETVQERAIMSYQVAFSEHFDFVNGGKLPGLYGGTGTCSGGTRSPACFSIRLMWRNLGMGEVYAYIPTYPAFNQTTPTKRAYGIDLDLGSWNFTIGAWNTVTEVALLNSDPGDVGPANGEIAVYYNGNLAFTRSDIVFRVDPAVGLDRFMFSTFFGGSDSTFWASKGGWAYFKDFQFFSGTDESTSAAANVTATFPANQ